MTEEEEEQDKHAESSRVPFVHPLLSPDDDVFLGEYRGPAEGPGSHSAWNAER